ncbi:MAG TPA: Gfo/Idh/MocA family oxidoreductase [Acidobacteriota bacterium]|nr:Gfo/Idh/MocA family oxidoreductase [Acidobacteriota bacterium]
MTNIAMLGTGFIGAFYTTALTSKRGRDRIRIVCGRPSEAAKSFAEKHGIPRWTNDIKNAVSDPEIDAVIIGLPNYLHKEAALLAARAGKAVMCTKPLARTAAEAKEMLEAVEKAGVFHGYLEDLAYTPKTLKAIQSVKSGALGKILWTRAREAHPGPHSDWFWKKELSGGGALIDMGCHCIEVGRNFIGKDIRPVEVMCWGATQVHPIEAEDHTIGLIRYASGAISQFEAAWTFRGGMDLRDEISGTEGTLWLNHWLRTGFEMFSATGQAGYVAEKAETEKGWLFPVGDESVALGYEDMFVDMLNALEARRQPMETFYDGYVVNAIMDAAYRSMESKRWEPVVLEVWRGADHGEEKAALSDFDENYYIIKQERMPDNRTKRILKHKRSGEIVQLVE